MLYIFTWEVGHIFFPSPISSSYKPWIRAFGDPSLSCKIPSEGPALADISKQVAFAILPCFQVFYPLRDSAWALATPGRNCHGVWCPSGSPVVSFHHEATHNPQATGTTGAQNECPRVSSWSPVLLQVPYRNKSPKTTLQHHKQAKKRHRGQGMLWMWEASNDTLGAGRPLLQFLLTLWDKQRWGYQSLVRRCGFEIKASLIRIFGLWPRSQWVLRVAKEDHT